MKDEELFLDEYVRLLRKPPRRLLKPKYQKLVLEKVKESAKQLKKNRFVENVFIGGSVVEKKLGKYNKYWGERQYSDIDLFVLLKGKIGTISFAKLKRIGLTKKRHTIKKNNKTETYYRIYVADKKGKPLCILNRFCVAVWLMSKYTMPKEMKRFPKLLKNTIEI